MLALLCLLVAPADIIVPAGGTLSLSADIVLDGSQSLLVEGTAAQPCAIIGNGHSIRSTTAWTGTLSIAHTMAAGLGTPSAVDSYGAVAFDLHASGPANVTVTDSTFSACNQFTLDVAGSAAVSICRNTWQADCLWWVDKDAYYGPQGPIDQNGVILSGDSLGALRFDNNKVLKAGVICGGNNWMIAGNIIAGKRAQLASYGLNTATGNYVHADLTTSEQFPYWSQVSAVDGTFTEFSGNVVNAGAWILEEISGDFHDNIVVNVHGHQFVRYGDAVLRRNVFAHIDPIPDRWGSDLVVGAYSFILEGRSGNDFALEGNVFDASAPALPGNPVIAGDVILVDGSYSDGWPGNVFFSTPDPRYPNVPAAFPYLDADILGGAVTVSEIVAYYQSVYFP